MYIYSGFLTQWWFFGKASELGNFFSVRDFILDCLVLSSHSLDGFLVTAVFLDWPNNLATWVMPHQNRSCDLCLCQIRVRLDRQPTPPLQKTPIWHDADCGRELDWVVTSVALFWYDKTTTIHPYPSNSIHPTFCGRSTTLKNLF